MFTPIAKASQFKAEAKADFDKKEALFRLIGNVSEETDFNAIQKYIFLLSSDIKKVILDLGGVERINSAGLQGWINFLARVQARFTVSIRELGEAFLEQAVMRTGVLGRPGTIVESFQICYLCVGCENTATETLLTLDHVNKQEFIAPPRECEDCGAKMEFDNFEATYTQLLKDFRLSRRAGPKP